MAKNNKTSAFFLILFVLGSILLGVQGYGYFTPVTYKSSSNSISLLPFALPMILPYIIYSLYNLLTREAKPIKTSNLDNLKDKIQTEIDFNKAIVEITELKNKENLDLEIIKEYLSIPTVKDFKSLLDNNNNTEQVESQVKIKYKHRGQVYYKTFILPFSESNAAMCLNLEKSTSLFIDETDPSKSIIDLGFVNNYI